MTACTWPAPGQLVYIVASREAALAMPETFVPVDDAIVGIVDQLAVDGEVRDARADPASRERQDAVKIGRVAGTVVSTICSPAYEGKRLLFCDLLDVDLEPTGKYLIAVDSVYAGAGETVLILDEGNGARQVTGIPGAPIRAVVVGVIDAVELS